PQGGGDVGPLERSLVQREQCQQPLRAQRQRDLVTHERDGAAVKQLKSAPGLVVLLFVPTSPCNALSAPRGRCGQRYRSRPIDSGCQGTMSHVCWALP